MGGHRNRASWPVVLIQQRQNQLHFLLYGCRNRLGGSAGVTVLFVVANGGSGARASTTDPRGGGAGGKGGDYSATLTRIPAGTTLSVFPGGAGSGRAGGPDAGGGGGSGADDADGNSGGGGGATTIAISPYSAGNLLVVAGGGGGAENISGKADGGAGGGGTIPEGRSGSPLTYETRGRGGTTSEGGAGGGFTGCTGRATSGTQLKGGNSNGGVCVLGAGGGGGSGYFGGGGAAKGAGGGGGSAFPRSFRSIHGIVVDPDIFYHEPHTGPGDVTISDKQSFPTHLTPDLVFNFQQTVTVYGTLDSGGTRLPAEILTFSTGGMTLCTAATDARGIASCALTYAQAIQIGEDSGRYTVTFAGTRQYDPSMVTGQSDIIS